MKRPRIKKLRERLALRIAPWLKPPLSPAQKFARDWRNEIEASV